MKVIAVLPVVMLSLLCWGRDKEKVTVEVVDTQNSTLHGELQGNGSAGSAIGLAIAGRKHTKTDASTMDAIVNGEHAKLDCFEHHKGCSTIAPGTYDGELDGKSGSIWVSYNMPLTHKLVRNHYRVAGSW